MGAEFGRDECTCVQGMLNRTYIRRRGRRKKVRGLVYHNVNVTNNKASYHVCHCRTKAHVGLDEMTSNVPA